MTRAQESKMATVAVVNEAKKKVLELVSPDQAEVVEDLFDCLEDVVAETMEQAASARERGYEEGLAASKLKPLLAALREFAIWHRDGYGQVPDLDPRVRELTGRQLWSQVVDAAGPQAGLPPDFARVLPQALQS